MVERGLLHDPAAVFSIFLLLLFQTELKGTRKKKDPSQNSTRCHSKVLRRGTLLRTSLCWCHATHTIWNGFPRPQSSHAPDNKDPTLGSFFAHKTQLQWVTEIPALRGCEEEDHEFVKPSLGNLAGASLKSQMCSVYRPWARAPGAEDKERSAMVNLDCQLDWTEWHGENSENTLLGLFGRMLSR